MTKDYRKERVMVMVLELFDFIDEEDRSAAFAEMAPKLSRALFRGKPYVLTSDTQPAMEAVRTAREAQEDVVGCQVTAPTGKYSVRG